jgi:TonB family protein
MSEDTSQPVEANSGPVTDAATAAAAAEIAAAPEVVSPEADPAAATDAATDASGAVRNLFGALDADQRIRTVVKQNERTLWAGAAAVTLIYVGIIALQVMQLSPAELAEMAKRKRGQDAPESISVELVPDPDKTSKTQKWQEGQTAAQNPEQPPQQYQPPQVASLQQPQLQEKPVKEDPKAKEEAKSEDEAKPEEDAPKAEEEKQFGPTLPDLNTLVDAAAADLDRKIKDALERKKQQQQRQREQRQAAAPGGALQIRGTGASGRSDPFSRSVIAALMKTRPGPFALWGRVLVSFQISESGQVAYVHLLQSSGNTALDQAAINAIRKAQFERPPTGLSPEDRTYIIDYIFG